MMPMMPAVSPHSANARTRIRLRLMPARRAASALPPIAYMYRPNRVRPSRKLYATSTTRITSTTHGTPRTTTAIPRLVLPMSTTTTPATAITATFSQVTLTGGAASLLARLRPSRTTNRPPASTTAAAMTIQPAVTLIAPLSMSDTTLLYSLMVPPELGAAVLMMYSRKPWPNRYPASVTTKDGSRSQVTITPWIPL